MGIFTTAVVLAEEAAHESSAPSPYLFGAGALAILVAERDNLGAEGQAALDELTAKVEAFDAEVGDADGSDTPPVVG